jgi:predicted kinase
MPQLIVFAGLPGSGKTTLAKMLAPRINAVILNKDEVRASLFVPEEVEYSSRQNDFCMEVIYQLAKYHFAVRPERPVIIDGRTFSRREQVVRLISAFADAPYEIHFILCECTLEAGLQRVTADKDHVATDRTAEMARRAYAQWQALEVPHLILHTDKLAVEQCLHEISRYIKKTSLSAGLG